MLRRLLSSLVLLASVGTAAAGDRTPTGICLDAARSLRDRHACIGETTKACRAGLRNPSNAELAICINGEAEWWQDRMKAAQDRMAAEAARLDAKFAAAIEQGAPRLTDDLAALQASWRDWTEKRCGFEAMLRRGQPFRSLVASDCMLRQTAEQALLLEFGATLNR